MCERHNLLKKYNDLQYLASLEMSDEAKSQVQSMIVDVHMEIEDSVLAENGLKPSEGKRLCDSGLHHGAPCLNLVDQDEEGEWVDTYCPDCAADLKSAHEHHEFAKLMGEKPLDSIEGWLRTGVHSRMREEKEKKERIDRMRSSLRPRDLAKYDAQAQERRARLEALRLEAEQL